MDRHSYRPESSSQREGDSSQHEGDSSQRRNNQPRPYDQYMQLENRPGGQSGEGGSSSASWWRRSASRLIDRSPRQSTDVNRYVDITERRAHMTQQGRTFDWHREANRNGDLTFMDNFQKKLDRSSSLPQMVSEETDRRQTERMQTVNRYVDLMEGKDLVTQQGFESEWNEQANENGDQAFMQKFRTRLENEPGIQEMLDKELDRRAGERKKMQEDVNRYVNAIDYKDTMYRANRQLAWHTAVEQNGDQDFMQEFQRRLGNDEAGTLQQMLNKELDQRRANQNDQYGRRITGVPSDNDRLPNYS